MVFQRCANFFELFERFREFIRHFSDRHRGTDTGHDVFTLSIDQEFTHQAGFTGSRVTGKRNTGTAIVAHVTERHHLHVDRSTPGVGDIVVTAIHVRTRVVPRTEHRFDSAHKLFFRVRREVFADFRFIFRFELASEFFQIFGGEFHVLGHAFFFFHLVDEFFKVFFADFHNNVGIHLNKTTIAVVSPASIARFGSHGFDNIFVQTEVQDGVHHTRHGSASARTHRNEQRVFFVTEFHTGDAFHLVDVLHNLSLDVIVDFTAIFIVLSASLSRNSEALRNRQTDFGHFSKVRTFTAQQLTHGRVAFAEQVHILVTHLSQPPTVNFSGNSARPYQISPLHSGSVFVQETEPHRIIPNLFINFHTFFIFFNFFTIYT